MTGLRGHRRPRSPARAISGMSEKAEPGGSPEAMRTLRFNGRAMAVLGVTAAWH